MPLINKNRLTTLSITSLLTLTCSSFANEQLGPLHVPSPDWREQVIYFLMIDRFNDGNPTNNDQGVGVYQPGAASKYNGGDIQGITQQLDYLQNLGITAVWTTPHVANQWYDPIAQYWGYHGYWARDFDKVDEHYGTLTDYQNLSRSLHKRGMYLIQDIVVNHTGNFFTYQGEYNPNNPQQNFVLNHQSIPTAKPEQFPFNLNNALLGSEFKQNIYHWTPAISSVNDPYQVKHYQSADLDDLNTQNPHVRHALKQSYGDWITKAGVDAFRIDTAKYVEADFYNDFIHADDGVRAIAKTTGRDDFFTFGEIFNTSLPYQDDGEQTIKKYLSDDTTKRIDAPINFPLYKEIENIFAGGKPTAQLSYRLELAQKVYADTGKLVNFIDNHDVVRFLQAGNIDGFKQAYVLLFTTPGIPVIYQGDEQAHILARQTMFAGGYGSEVSQFNPNSEMYKHIQTLAKLRKQSKVFTHGKLNILADSEFGAGVFAYQQSYQGQSAYVLMNTANEPVLLSQINTSLNPQKQAKLLFSLNLTKAEALTNTQGFTGVLPARSVAVFYAEKGASANKQIKQNKQKNWITSNKIAKEFINQNQASISGQVSQANAKLLRVIDGRLSNAKAFTADKNGAWQVDLPVNDLGSYPHSIEIYSPELNISSEKQLYKVSYQQGKQITQQDPTGDDKGLANQYQLAGYQQNACYLDIQSASAKYAGKNLQLTLTMCDISTDWAPPNGMDHLALTVFIDLANKTGATSLPKLNATMPAGLNWDLANSLFGWGNYIFTNTGASAEQDGEKFSYAPDIQVDKQAKTITLTYRGEFLDVEQWQASRIYVTTWDKDEKGEYRHISDQAAEWSFSLKAQTNQRSKIADAVLIKL
ncbi:alpha-amylase family glycosyl hydrolase [Catenovulum agarivorans]|uniref:alpha-amylase family glycosyl hydrolase n=1 Tax=Catenovulum agarivorans TaxID=1172192 RepID=UPI0002E011FC|nr:alpha-amylase family glycosyl hydrolase [Catenovulum agarivorans]